MVVDHHATPPGIHATASQRLKDRVVELTRRFLRGRQPDFMKQHSRALDDYFETAFESSMIGPRMEINKNPYAIVALGGYGREEQCIHSDVDLLFLFAKRVPPDAENLIREMIYPLWDIGMDVGYATRSVKECLSLAAADLNILTPLLDARFICGMSMLFSDLMAQLRDNVIRKRRDRLMDQLLASTRCRHAQFGDSAYLLEPHLKEGQGGLRDYHAMLWIARLDTDLRQPRDLEYLGLLSHSEYQQLWDGARLHLDRPQPPAPHQRPQDRSAALRDPDPDRRNPEVPEARPGSSRWSGSNLDSRLLHSRAGLPAVGVQAGGVPEVVAQIGEHRVQHFRQDRGGGVVVEVDGA